MTPADVTAALDRLGLNQTEAAELLGVSHSTVSRWCSGRRRIPGPAATLLRSWLVGGLPDQHAALQPQGVE